MRKWKGKEKVVQAGYVKVLPPLQKKDSKDGQRHSTGEDTPTAGRDKPRQSPRRPPPPIPQTAVRKKISEPTPPKISITASSPGWTKDRKARASVPECAVFSQQLDSLIAQSLLSTNSTSHSSKVPHQRPRSATENIPPPLNDIWQPEQDMKQFVRTGDAVSLWSIANSDNVQLPQLFVAESKYDGPPVIEKGQVIMVVKIKTVTLVHGIHSDGKEVTLSSSSSPKLSPLGEGMKVSQSLPVKALLSHKPLPPVVAVAKQFPVAGETIVPSGTLLFLQQGQPSAAQDRTKDLQPALLVRDLGGREFTLTAKCTGIFSTHPRDTALMLQELVKHCQFPLKVCDYDSKEEMTLQSVTHQQMFLAYPFNAGQKSESTVFELPAEGSLQLVRVVMTSKEMEMNTQPCNNAEESELEHNYEVISEYVEREHPQQASPTQKVTSANATKQDSVARTPSQDIPSTRGSPLRSPPCPSGASAIGTTDEYNEKRIAESLVYLKSLNAEEVLELLEGMQLEEYRESFKKEKIDGEVLSSLTEEDLLQELNIQKRLHRVRLMKVIEGVYSARDILTQIYI